MKKKNISLCAITATLFFGNHANAADFVVAKDNTVVIIDRIPGVRYFRQPGGARRAVARYAGAASQIGRAHV